jgi:hypothetical protein
MPARSSSVPIAIPIGKVARSYQKDLRLGEGNGEEMEEMGRAGVGGGNPPRPGQLITPHRR